MNMHAVLIRAAILPIMCLGLSIAMPRQNPAEASRLATRAVAPARSMASTASLPMVVLPTITVRPSAAEIAAAMNPDMGAFDDAPRFIKAAQEQPLFDTAVSLRSLRLDMPYYSFGKVLPRVSKE